MIRFSLPLGLLFAMCLTHTQLHAQTQPQNQAVLSTIAAHQYDLDNGGRSFLLGVARNSDYFLLGELHGDREIPLLLHYLWPEMWTDGYRYVAAEVSPWTASLLEASGAPGGPRIEGLWTKQQAADLHTVAGRAAHVVWGCDMEEIHPEWLIRELARLNPEDSSLKKMTDLASGGYKRTMAAELLAIAETGKLGKDEVVNDVSLRRSLIATLEIDANRAAPATRMAAQNEREMLMKTQFLAHVQTSFDPQKPTKVLLRFGRNHLHRGYDARGISTLGNFVAEYAVSRGQSAFNVGAFGAGGKATLMGETFSMDETEDELAFAFLASMAQHSATVFDLRPLRPLLHAIPQEKRTPLDANLIYWSDAYDALICYKNVTPLDN